MAADIAAASPARAADRQSIDLAPGRLGEAVVALGRQTGASIGMSDQSLAGIATPAIRGRMSTASALSQLLRGSGAKARQIDASTWRIVRARKSTPPPSPTPAAAVQLAPVVQEPPADIIVTASKRDI
ncbi:MAG: TonB-dependent receptor, partial [Sphingobium sp.]